MGIDKPDVRFVIHHCMSKSMENFYQESGRAGRDSAKAKCILLYKFSDISRLSTMVFTETTGLEKLYGIISYCLNSKSCRRKLIAEHFGEDWQSNQCDKMCDNCKNQGMKLDFFVKIEFEIKVAKCCKRMGKSTTRVKVI